MEGQVLTLIVLSGLLFSAAVGLEETKRTRRQAPNVNIHQIPKTSFSCADKKLGEYYADPETGCQVYHICLQTATTQLYPMSFACPNGTIFNQPVRVCTPYERVDCKLATRFYDSLHGNPYLRYEDYEDKGPEVFPLRPPTQYREPEEPPVRQAPSTRPPARQVPSFRPPVQRATAPPPQVSRQSVPQPPQVSRQPPQVIRTVQQSRQPVRQEETPAFPPPRTSFPVRPPVLPARLPIPVTVRPPVVEEKVVTSTSQYEYDYEYEYEYDDPNQPQSSGRTKRDTSFTCHGKQPGSTHPDLPSNCRMFHVCMPVTRSKMKDVSISCGKGKAYSVITAKCEDKDKVQCQPSKNKKNAKKIAIKRN